MQQISTLEDIPYVTLPEDYQSNPGRFLARMYQQHAESPARKSFGEIQHVAHHAAARRLGGEDDAHRERGGGCGGHVTRSGGSGRP